MSMVGEALAFVSESKTDILIFLVSIGIHAVVFGKYRLFGRQKGRAKPARPHVSEASAQELVACPTTAAERTYAKKIREASGATAALSLLNRATSEGNACDEVLLASASVATAHSDEALALSMVKTLPAKPQQEVVTAALGLFAQGGPLGRADSNAALLRLYSERLRSADLTDDAVRQVGHAASCQGDTSAMLHLLSGAKSASTEVALLQDFASEQGLPNCLGLLNSCRRKTPSLYTSFVEVCLGYQDVDVAEGILREAAEVQKADAAAYKLMAKFHISKGDANRALTYVKRVRADCVVVSSAFFCELIEMAVREKRDIVWDLLEEMKQCRVKPTQAICMQAIKCAQRSSKLDSMGKALRIVEALDDTICETVFSAVCEAAIQTGSYNLLVGQLKKHWHAGKVCAKSTYTYASVIRACGYTNDLRGVWGAWNQMKSRHIPPASVTLGCMVEALASNGDVQSGYQIIQEHISDPQLKSLVNAVIYCSVLKGFSHQKRFDRVWSIYEEMKREQIQFSIVTYNTLIDACSRSRDISRISEMLEEMAAANIKPNTITYGAIIKGYCSGPENRMNQAFALLEQMKSDDSQVTPDEVTYNTLLDGCARSGMWERGMKLLEEMQEEGVKPSNFTLSVLVKLANRSKRHGEGFRLADDLAKKYGIRLNVHVYNNLIQSCLLGADFARAMQVFKQLLSEKVRPDGRTYLLLLQAAVGAKLVSDAAGLIRAAGGLRGAHPIVTGYSDLAQPKGGLSADLVSETIEGIANMSGTEEVVAEMLLDIEGVSSLPVDRRRLVRSTNKALRAQKAR